MTDHIVATALGEIESRMGVPPIEMLLAERDDLVKQVAPLRAKHGPGGTYQDVRKLLLAQLAARLRAVAVGEERKITEAALEEGAHSHQEYVEFIAQATEEKAHYFEIENRITGIADQINRGQAVARYLASEIALSR